ncbi:MAG TPA: hypothetical protein VNS88_18160 [Nitrospiraceae bacterium]|nr:hypothetical protein [Nitrospiraceae bacterium]
MEKERRTCKWFVSEAQPECGKPAVAKVRVKGRVTQATVDVCSQHKAEHDESFAKLRTSLRRAAS